MTPSKFKEHRYDLALTQEELACILNTTARTIRRWETEDDPRPVNPIAIRVMEWMIWHKYEPIELLLVRLDYRPDEISKRGAHNIIIEDEGLWIVDGARTKRMTRVDFINARDKANSSKADPAHAPGSPDLNTARHFVPPER